MTWKYISSQLSDSIQWAHVCRKCLTLGAVGLPLWVAGLPWSSLKERSSVNQVQTVQTFPDRSFPHSSDQLGKHAVYYQNIKQERTTNSSVYSTSVVLQLYLRGTDKTHHKIKWLVNEICMKPAAIKVRAIKVSFYYIFYSNLSNTTSESFFSFFIYFPLTNY